MPLMHAYADMGDYAAISPPPTYALPFQSEIYATSSSDKFHVAPTSPVTVIGADSPPLRRSSHTLSTPMRFREPATVTTASGTMLRKQKLKDREERLRQQHDARLSEPPPTLPSLPVINNPFGRGDARPDSFALVSEQANSIPRPSNTRNTMPLSSTTGSSPASRLPLMSSSRDASSSPSNSVRVGGSVKNGTEYVDHLSTESITHRGRSSYGTSVDNGNSPRRVRRRKDPTPFNILVIGAKSSGKTSFVEFLKDSFALPAPHHPSSQSPPRMTTTDGSFTSHYVEADMDGERVGLTVWDSQGLERSLVDLQLREMITFIESKFEDTFTQEQKVSRAPGVKDSHIHCVLLLLDPVRLDSVVASNRSHATSNATAPSQPPAGLDDELNLLVMKTLVGKTTVIPVISKADSLTAPHMAFLKQSVWASIEASNLNPLEALGPEEDSQEEFDTDSDDPSSPNPDAIADQGTDDASFLDDSSLIDNLVDRSDSSIQSFNSQISASPPTTGDKPSKSSHTRQTSQTFLDQDDLYIPFSVLTPDPHAPNVKGRQFPWGVADPYDATHCDFVRLRDSVFTEWRTELRLAAREKWYENWRTSRLKRTPQRVRQTHGATPVAALPMEGRSINGGARKNSAGGLSVGSLSLSPAGGSRSGSADKADRLLGTGVARTYGAGTVYVGGQKG